MRRRLLFLLALTFCSSRSVHAQRVVRETEAQWSNAHVLRLERQQTWCAQSEAAGCDFKSIDNAFLLPGDGIIASAATGPLRKYSAQGAFVSELGHRGQGPGEYGFIAQPQLVGNEVVWFDNSQMRAASVSLDGKPGVVQRLPFPRTTVNFYMVGRELVVFDVPATPTPGDSVMGVYHTVPSEGQGRVFISIRTPSLSTLGDGFRPARAPFEHRIVADVGTRGDVAHSNGDSYTLDLHPTTGTPWNLQVAAPRRPIAREDRDSVEQQYLKLFRAVNMASLPPQVQSFFPIKQKTFPALNAVRVLRDGTVWIKPNVPATGTQQRWDVFSVDGKRIGVAMLPSGASIADGERSWVLVIELNEDDVPGVVRYRVR